MNRIIIYEESKQRSEKDQRYSYNDHQRARSARLDRVSVGRTLRFAAVNDLFMVSKEHDSNDSVIGADLHGVWNYDVRAFRGRRQPGFPDALSKKAVGELVKTG